MDYETREILRGVVAKLLSDFKEKLLDSHPDLWSLYGSLLYIQTVLSCEPQKTLEGK